MAKLYPASKGSATVTAMICKVAADDLQNAMVGLRNAELFYREGNYEAAAKYVLGAQRLIEAVMGVDLIKNARSEHEARNKNVGITSST